MPRHLSASDLTTVEAAALLSGKTEWDSRELPARAIPSFVMSDGPHGVRRQLGSGDHLGIAASEPATCFPTAATVANSWDSALLEDMGQALGKEARALGVDVLLGPGLNIKRNPLCGRNFEYYSEDPLLSGRLAAALIRGIQSQGVAATPKHFAVNSQEERRMTSDSIVDERTMRELYLTGFEIAVREGKPRALMSSYNKVNGTYANENPHLLLDILRDEWGFDGMVVSDWGGSNDAVEAARNGSSLEMPGPGLEGAQRISAAVRSGALTREVLNERAQEVLTMAFDAAQQRESLPAIELSSALIDAHDALAQRIAEESLVLLRNEDSFLPLSQGCRVGIIGDFAFTPRYQGAGSSMIHPTRLTSLVDACSESSHIECVGAERGFERFGGDNEELAVRACELARRCDVVIFACGLDELHESEGADRIDMILPENQRQLITRIAAINPHIVVVLSAGAAIDMTWRSAVPAILHSYLAGQAGARAVVRALTGEVNPSGKLAETYALRYQDIPSAGDYPSRSRNCLYTEGPYVGYRYFNTAGVSVAFPFGWGLSYSRFEYSDMEVHDNAVEFTLRNTSEREGSEIAQMYVCPPETIWGPRKELKGFAKIRLRAGESQRVRIPFDRYTFRHYDTQTQQWQEEGGVWRIVIGANAEHEALSSTCTRDGQTSTLPDSPLMAPYLSGKVSSISVASFEALLGRSIPAKEEHQLVGFHDEVLVLARARNPLARMGARYLEKKRRAAESRGAPDLNIMFIQNMPFRAIPKMTRGAVSIGMVEALLQIVNGSFVRGTSELFTSWRENRRMSRHIERVIATGDSASKAPRGQRKEGQ